MYVDLTHMAIFKIALMFRIHSREVFLFSAVHQDMFLASFEKAVNIFRWYLCNSTNTVRAKVHRREVKMTPTNYPYITFMDL
mmetsp:Transcript_71819/g.136687  ORF Transcript_71819/g.136687 Transcript_71819/m.136687 type:complete len:82 (+) Transcript_71819:25-270(+)